MKLHKDVIELAARDLRSTSLRGIFVVVSVVSQSFLHLAQAHIEEELNITQPQVAAAHKWLQSSEPTEPAVFNEYDVCITHRVSEYRCIADL